MQARIVRDRFVMTSHPSKKICRSRYEASAS
jgi:hypothetical protein